MNEQQASNTTASAGPVGYEPREVIWPTTGERITAYFPAQSTYTFGS